MGYTQKDMAYILGIRQTAYSNIETGRSSLTDRNKNHLIERLGINPSWLNGDDSVEMMTKESFESNKIIWPAGISSVDSTTSKEHNSSEAKSPCLESCSAKGRPYYDIDFICGFDELFNSHTTTPAYLIDYPPYNKDGVIWCNATGSSMEPEINNGDVVVLQEVQDWDSYMTFGETYAIATRNNLRTIKKVRKGSDSDHLLLVPVNKDYDEQEIPKNMILKVFRVLAAMKKF